MITNKLVWLLCILSIIVLPGHRTLAYSTRDTHQLYKIEPLTSVKYEIAPRSTQFFQKRHQSRFIYIEPRHIEYDDHVQLTLEAYNTTFQLNLEPNLDLFHPTAAINMPHVQVYKGQVMTPETAHDLILGWARIIIRNDLISDYQPIFEGAFSYRNDLYHIKSIVNYNLVKRFNDPSITETSEAKMIIYRDSDTSLTKRDNQQHQCGFDNMIHPQQQEQQTYESNSSSDFASIFHVGGLLKKRFDQGCPTTKKINYMGAAADCTYVQYYKSVDAARIQIINDFNMASAVFEKTFNIGLGLINITMMDPMCPMMVDENIAWNRGCDASYGLGDRLSDFSQWRATMSNDGAGLWHLMTNCPTGVEVGLAWLKQLCKTGTTTQISSEGRTEYVSGAGVSAVTLDEWKVVAHEIGHGFGAIHDCTSDTCPCNGSDCQCCPYSTTQCDSGADYLMGPVTNTTAEYFSPCSINTVCSAFPEIGSCLSDPQEHLHSIYQLNVCGNGIKEIGEECDTGGVDTACCNAKTCKLKKSAVCEDQNDSCCEQCQIRPQTHVCRPAESSCDIEEYCTGDSPTCPDDTYLRDGTSCGVDDNGVLLKCASGQCTSRDAQCLSRGSVMNITQSCLTNNEECKMLCNTPGANKCLLFSGNFLDGTPCGFGGRCLAGQCQNGGAINSSLLWMKENEQIAIPVIIVAFLFVCGIGFCLFWFGCWRCTGYKEKRRLKNGKLSVFDLIKADEGLLPPRCDENNDRIGLPEPTIPLFANAIREKSHLDILLSSDTPPPPSYKQNHHQKRSSTNNTTLDNSSSVSPTTTFSSSSSSLTVVAVEERITAKPEKNE